MPEKIYESPASLPDDDLWLEQGRAMVKESLTSVRSAASSLMTGLGALQGIYLGILGFAKFVPEDAKLPVKFLFVTPLLVWMIALYHCLKVMMTEAMEVKGEFAGRDQTAPDAAGGGETGGADERFLVAVRRDRGGGCAGGGAVGDVTDQTLQPTPTHNPQSTRRFPLPPALEQTVEQEDENNRSRNA